MSAIGKNRGVSQRLHGHEGESKWSSSRKSNPLAVFCSVTLSAMVWVCVLLGCMECLASSPRVSVLPVLVAEGVSDGLIVGGVKDGRWVSAEAVSKWVAGGQKYKLYSGSRYLVSAVGTASGTERDKHCFVHLSETNDEFVIGIAGGWDAMPRVASEQSTTNPVYVNAVKRVLADKGLRNSQVNITRVLRVDLEGDGRDEVLIAARSRDFSPFAYKKGEYSVVLLRRLVGKKAETRMLKGEFHKRSLANEFPECYEIAGLWDVDGDRVLEIGVRWNCQKADVGGLALFDMDRGRTRLLADEGVGN